MRNITNTNKMYAYITVIIGEDREKQRFSSKLKKSTEE